MLELYPSKHALLMTAHSDRKYKDRLDNNMKTKRSLYRQTPRVVPSVLPGIRFRPDFPPEQGTAPTENLSSIQYFYRITLGDDITHPLGRILGPVSSKGRGAHTTKMVALPRFCRQGCIDASLGVFSTPSPVVSKLRGGVVLSPG